PSDKIVTSVDGVGHTDDLWYDAAHKRIYMSGGDGEIAVYEQRDTDHLSLYRENPQRSGRQHFILRTGTQSALRSGDSVCWTACSSAGLRSATLNVIYRPALLGSSRSID